MLAVMDFQFFAVMGSVVGEKITRAVEHAIHRVPARLIIVSASSGARMQEGMLSPHAMANFRPALVRSPEARLLISGLLTDPTTGGVTAVRHHRGYQPCRTRALIGFAGPRVVKETIHQNLPPVSSSCGVHAASRHDRCHRAPHQTARENRRAARIYDARLMGIRPAFRQPQPVRQPIGNAMTYPEAIHWLFSTQMFGIKLGLEGPRGLLRETLAYPAHGVKVIHVAGTNGKGSTCAMIDSVARACGLRTGLFTSPHLVDYCERTKVCGRDIPQDECARLLATLRRVCEDMETHPTFFEITLALSMRWFRERECELVILETGMGGRLMPPPPCLRMSARSPPLPSITCNGSVPRRRKSRRKKRVSSYRQTRALLSARSRRARGA